MNRFRPRFTVRSLAIFVTFVCVYLGAWEATKRYGLPNGMEATSPFPLIVVQTEFVEIPRVRLADPYSDYLLTKQVYLWLFGPKIKLPVGVLKTFRTLDSP